VLTHPTHDRLIALGLGGMAKAFEEQRAQPDVASLTFEERLGLLVDREAVESESKRLVTRLKFANLRQNATVEDLNTKAARGLDKALSAKLATGDWIGRRQDLLITGKTGHSYLATLARRGGHAGVRARVCRAPGSTLANHRHAFVFPGKGQPEGHTGPYDSKLFPANQSFFTVDKSLST
jgi:IstB-like ATP binding protein